MINKSLPLVSIIIPLYNSEKYIGQTIESAISQTWPTKEIIVVDNNSTDKSCSIAKKYGEQGLISLYKQEKKGACAARNLGFSKSKGDYIQFLDADDLIDSNKVEFQMNILKNNPHCIASCKWAKFKQNKSEAVFLDRLLYKDFLPVEWLLTAWDKGDMMQTACWLTERSLIESAGLWDETLISNPADDGEFFCRVILKSKRVIFSEKSLVYYREAGINNLSQNLSKEAVSSLFMNCVKYEEHVLKMEENERVKKVLVKNYADFIYRFYPNYKPYINQARIRIIALGFYKYPLTGGKWFRRISSIIGFNTALKVRTIFNALKIKI